MSIGGQYPGRTCGADSMIRIKTKLAPFSHTPGITALIPGTTFAAEVFPALIRFWDLAGVEKKCVKEIPCAIEGPLSTFTVIQDLERGVVTVWQERKCFHILPTLEIVSTRNPGHFSQNSSMRLSLGSHKKQEWEGIKKRLDFCEIFPLWLQLGRLLKLPDVQPTGGMFALLEECKEAIEGKPEHILAAFQALFLAGFEGMLVPHLFDNQHLGIAKEEGGNNSPLHLLTEGAQLILSLFIKVGKHEISLLPHLPPAFFAGRVVGYETPYGTLHFEWTKKMIRRVFFESRFEGALLFRFPSVIKEFRLQGGKKYHNAFEPVEIKSGTLYLLDRFQK